MTAFPFAIVGFDLDGTLLDTAGDLAAAVDHALASEGRPPLGVDRVRPMIGGGARHMLAQGLTAAGVEPDAPTLDRLVPILLAYYEANIAVQTRPFAGAMAAVEDLASRGVRVAIVTNKVQRLAAQVLGALGIADRFDCVIGGDTLGPGRGKPAPDPILEMIHRCGGGRAAFVGDSIYDTQAARAAGVPSVAVSFGFLMEPIEELGADAVINSYAELVPTLDRLGRG